MKNICEEVRRSPLFSSLPESSQAGSPSRRGDSHVYGGTRFLIEQKREVMECERTMTQQKNESYEMKKNHWDRLRVEKKLKIDERSKCASIKRQLRDARIAAAEAAAKDAQEEREILSYEERKFRSDVEHLEREDRRCLSFFAWQSETQIHTEMKLRRVMLLEIAIRSEACAFFISDVENRYRQFWARLWTVDRTMLLSSEKTSRITLLKQLNVQWAWRAAQEAEITALSSQERRGRAKVGDEEVNAFSTFENEKNLWLADLHREAKRQQEVLISKQKQHEETIIREQREVDADEAETRAAIRLEETAARNCLRDQRYLMRQVAEKAYKQRVDNELRLWEEECQRQRDPMVAGEEEPRRRIEHEATVSMNNICASFQEAWTSLLNPLDVNLPQKCTDTTAASGWVFPFTDISISRKPLTPLFPCGPCTELKVIVRGLAGLHAGDEVELIPEIAQKGKEKLSIVGNELVENGKNLICTVDVEKTGGERFVDDEARLMAQLDFPSGVKLLTLDLNIAGGDWLRALLRCLTMIGFRCPESSTNLDTRSLVLELNASFARRRGSVRRLRPSVDDDAQVVTVYTSAWVRYHRPLIYRTPVALSPWTESERKSTFLSSSSLFFDQKQKLKIFPFADSDSTLFSPHSQFVVKIKLTSPIIEDTIVVNTTQFVQIRKNEIISGDRTFGVIGRLSPAFPISSRDVTISGTASAPLVIDIIRRIGVVIDGTKLSPRTIELSLSAVPEGADSMIASSLVCDLFPPLQNPSVGPQLELDAGVHAPRLFVDNALCVPDWHLASRAVNAVPILREVHLTSTRSGVPPIAITFTIDSAATLADELVPILSPPFAIASDGHTIQYAKGHDTVDVARIEKGLFKSGRLVPHCVLTTIGPQQTHTVESVVSSMCFRTIVPRCFQGSTKRVGVSFMSLKGKSAIPLGNVSVTVCLLPPALRLASSLKHLEVNKVTNALDPLNLDAIVIVPPIVRKLSFVPIDGQLGGSSFFLKPTMWEDKKTAGVPLRCLDDERFVGYMDGPSLVVECDEPSADASSWQTVLRGIGYTHDFESDMTLQKRISVRATGTGGEIHEEVLTLDVQPTFLPSYFEGVPSSISYCGTQCAVTGGSMRLFGDGVVLDEDTTACGSGGYFIIGATTGNRDTDAFCLLPIEGATSIRQGDADSWEIIDVCTDVVLGRCVPFEKGGLRVNVADAVPLSACTQLLRCLAFRVEDPAGCVERHTISAFLVFNACDEVVPDTRVEVHIQIESPPFSIAPLYRSLNGCNPNDTRPFRAIGCYLPTDASGGDRLHICTSDPQCKVVPVSNADVTFTSDHQILVQLSTARRLLKMTSLRPTPGYDGLVLGVLSHRSPSTLDVQLKSEARAALIPLFLASLSVDARHAGQHITTDVVWEKDAGETHTLSVSCETEGEAVGVNIQLESEDLCAFDGEILRLFREISIDGPSESAVFQFDVAVSATRSTDVIFLSDSERDNCSSASKPGTLTVAFPQPVDIFGTQGYLRDVCFRGNAMGSQPVRIVFLTIHFCNARTLRRSVQVSVWSKPLQWAPRALSMLSTDTLAPLEGVSITDPRRLARSKFHIQIVSPQRSVGKLCDRLCFEAGLGLNVDDDGRVRLGPNGPHLCTIGMESPRDMFLTFTGVTAVSFSSITAVLCSVALLMSEDTRSNYFVSESKLSGTRGRPARPEEIAIRTRIGCPRDISSTDFVEFDLVQHVN